MTRDEAHRRSIEAVAQAIDPVVFDALKDILEKGFMPSMTVVQRIKTATINAEDAVTAYLAAHLEITKPLRDAADELAAALEKLILIISPDGLAEMHEHEPLQSAEAILTHYRELMKSK